MAIVWWLILSVVFIYLVDLFTIKPDVISGNGNLGLLFVVPALALFILFVRSLWRYLGTLNLKSNTWMKIVWGAFAILLLLSFLQYKLAIDLVTDLGGSPKIESSKIYRYPWLNQYTNTLFINFYTLGIMTTGITILRIFIRNNPKSNSEEF
ncbi:hypothetical protein [Bacillus sp. ISL-37]|uniref:hypothetical protein n=1 Tax=Bacillus sp. ISL-37 TaxID=2819123 RepID=UPI001BEB5375|nr:hypothetical protein [Bacillus sp. ISL-37]MBT2682312.1 hypothetical protein [Bacillus sp. ISL-37]